MAAAPGLHRFVIPLSLDVAEERWAEVAEPWMAPVELEPAGTHTIATVRPAHEDHGGYQAAFDTARRIHDFLAATRVRRTRQRRGEVLPPVGPVAGHVEPGVPRPC